MNGMSLAVPLRRGDLRNALVAYARTETDAGRIDAMSLRAAARDLGVSSGAVYRHFADKDDLLKEVAFQGFIEMRQRYFEIRPEGDEAPTAEEAVRRTFRMGRTFVDFADENRTLWRMMFGRIGVMCRCDKVDAELMRYTVLDCTLENLRDLHRLGGIPDEPVIEDVRYMWSAIHGAADLTQSGIRLDTCSMTEVADQTTERSLRALGCERDLIARGRPPLACGE